MRRIKVNIGRFGRDTSGATAIEYGLIAGIVSIVILVALFGIRDELITLPMQEIANAFDTGY